jgi:coenzyme F420 hydrogenase subunit beta
MDVQHVYDDGLCMQCGTCEGICPADAVTLDWNVAAGFSVHVDRAACTDCGLCHEACPGPGLDFGPGAWWRERNEQAPHRDFLGPWRSLHFGWASDPAVRHAGASGGIATALLAGALEEGLADAVLAVDSDATNPLRAAGVVCRTPDEVAACRGSKYNVVAVNVLLRQVLERDGRYVLVGLPCHVQGLRLAQRRSRRLRERIILTLGIFCGLTCEPRATEIAALQAGLDPTDLAAVRYRGPGWPGYMEIRARDGRIRRRTYPDYYDDYLSTHVPPRCRICPDALAELADISIGDAWLSRFEGADGVSDLIVRTPAGERMIGQLAGRLHLMDAEPDEMVASQSETYGVKRNELRGRLWLRRLAGRAVPDYPGLQLSAGPRERLLGLAGAGKELVYRRLAERRFPSPPRA